MTERWVPQSSFAKGEAAPSRYGRFDLAFWSSAAKVLENFWITRGGEAVNAPGTRFIGEVKDSTKRTRLIPFSYNTQQTYILEFGDEYMRVIKDGGYVVYSSGPDAGDVFEIETPYTEDQLFLIKYVQSNDVLTLNHPSHPTYDLTRYDHDSWTLEEPTIGVTTPAPINGTATAVGGSGSTAYNYVVTAVNAETSEESLPSTVISVNNDSSLSNSVYNRIEWDAVTATASARGSFRVASSGSDATRASGSFTGINQYAAKGTWNVYVGSVQISTGSRSGKSGQEGVVNAINNANNGYSAQFSSAGTGTLTVTAPPGIQYNGLSLRLNTGSSNNINSTLTGSVAATHSGEFSDVTVDGTSVMSSAVPWAGSVNDTAFNIASRITASNLGYTAESVGAIVYIYAPESEGSTPNGFLVDATTTGTLSATNKSAMAGGGSAATGGASSYNIYKEKNGVYGFIGKSNSTQFEDKNIAPDVGDTPQEERNPFSNNNNPLCATYYEQRKVFGHYNQELNFSQAGAYKNFNVSTPRRDDDAITRRIAARKVNEIRHLVPLRELLCLTSGGIWKVSAGGNSDAITPSSMTVRLQTEIGVSHVAPIVINDTILYVQEKGSIVRDMGYSFAADNYVGNDLSIISEHLFEGNEIVEWAYAAVPYSMIFAVMSNGKLCTLTYLKEQELAAWTPNITDGQYESVAVVSEGNEDAVYVIVRRFIDGAWKRYVERFASRIIRNLADSFFVHSGLTYEGEATDEISGLEHLEGKEVAILCDGAVLPNMVVTDGGLTLPVEGSKIHIGLPYVSELETLPIGDQQGGIGVRKKITHVRARVDRSRGMWVGPNRDDMTEMKRDEGWTNSYMDDEVEILTIPQNGESVTAIIQQRDPLPLSVLALIPKVDA